MDLSVLTNEAFNEELSRLWIVFLIAVTLALPVVLFAWRRKFFEWESGTPWLVNINGRDVFKAFFYFIFFQAFLIPSLVTVSYILITGEHWDTVAEAPSVQVWLSSLIVAGGFFGVMLAYFDLNSSQRRLMWGYSSERGKDFRLGALTWLIIYPVVVALGQLVGIVVLLLFQELPTDQVAVKHVKYALENPLLFAVTFVSVGGIVPLLEELLFRGFLQSWIKFRLKSSKWAIVITSIVFALFHFSASQGVTNIELLFSLFILSCFLGFLYERQQSLWAPIGLHACFNTLSMLMILFEK
jgi:membrane protease YdiL (CAAX protease family)